MHSLCAPRFFALPVALACLLTACGGGGDDATSPPSGDGFTLGGAVTGLGQSPSIDAVMQLVGRERVLARLDRVIAQLSTVAE